MAKRHPPQFGADAGPALHAARWRFGEFELNEGQRQLSRGGLLLEIEPKPLNMLMLLLRHPGELVTKNDLMEALWTGRIVTESVLSNCAAKLRAVLGDDTGLSGGPKLRTVHGYGFRLEVVPELLGDETTAPPAEEALFAPGQVVPFRSNWQLKRRLASTGETWLAEQTLTGHQRVFKFAHHPRALSALKREVTLYRLLRQNLEARAPIVELLDWNFDEPPWFIEARYCELGSLTDYFDSQGGVKALSLEARLDLVCQLAEALAAVHAHGILHKDLKPANILVAPDDSGGLRLLLGDFGSGRLLDQNQLQALAITRLGFTHIDETGGSSSSGTPLYYAPEVLSGHPVTLKADIYALGVIFYQLVVGDLRRLFAPGWEAGIADPLLREDIAACAAGDPHQRLPDAQLLADRIRQRPERSRRRALEQQQAEAQAALRLALQTAKARRSGLMVAAAVLALGLVVSLALYVRAERARSAADAARAEAVVTRDFVLKDVLGTLADGDEPLGSMTVARLLEAAAQEVGTRFKDQASLEASVRTQLGLALVKLQLREAAAAQFSQALSRGVALQTRAPEEYVALATAHLINEYNRNRFAVQAEALRQLHARSKQLLPAHHPSLFGQYLALASAEETAGYFQRALAVIENAATAAEHASHLSAKKRVSVQLHLGRIQAINGAFSLATVSLQQALASAREVYGPEHAMVAEVLLQLGEATARRGQFEESALALAQAQNIAQVWEPQAGELRLSVLGIRGLLAAERQDAVASRQVLAEFSALLPKLSPELAQRSTYQIYLAARLAAAEGRWSEALRLGKALEQRGVDETGASVLGLLRPEIWHIQAKALLKTQEPEAARKILERLEREVLPQLPAQHFIRDRQTPLWAEVRSQTSSAPVTP